MCSRGAVMGRKEPSVTTATPDQEIEACMTQKGF
jgi:hypothetical protein